MKVLFLHLSDAHLLSNTFIDNKIINAQVQALNSLGEFDKCYIISLLLYLLKVDRII